jgi:hypothetical protein
MRRKERSCARESRTEAKKLVVVPKEAEAVRTIFRRYLVLGSLGMLIDDLDRLGIKPRNRIGPTGFLRLRWLTSAETFAKFGDLGSLWSSRCYRDGETWEPGGSLPNPVLTAKGRRFATGSAIFRGSSLGDPTNCCISGHIRHKWPGSANRMKTLTAKDAKYGFGWLIDLARTKSRSETFVNSDKAF